MRLVDHLTLHRLRTVVAAVAVDVEVVAAVVAVAVVRRVAEVEVKHLLII